MLYPRGHAKNQLQKWGERADKNFQYYANNNMKVKREGAIKMTVTGMFRTTQHVGSEMPHEDSPEKVTYCAIVNYTLPDGSIKTKDTIPLESVLAGKILGGLDHKHEFDAWGRYIDWYCNSDRTDKNVNPIRFLVLKSSLYSAFDKSHVRDQHADGSVKDTFACETPATRKFSAKSPQEQRKIKDARGKQAAKRQERLEDSDQYNHRTGQKYTKFELSRKRESNEVNKQHFANIGEAMELHFPHEDSKLPARIPEKVVSEEEIAAKRQEISYLTNLIAESTFTNEWFSEHMRGHYVQRALAVGMEVSDVIWPVAALPSATKRAMCKGQDASDADKHAMVMEKDAVRRMIDRARNEHLYFNPDNRKTLTKRAVDCGLHIVKESDPCTNVDDIIWPKLTLVESASKQKMAQKRKLAEM